MLGGEGQQTWVEDELITDAKWRFVANSVSNAAMVVDLSTESITRFLETYPDGNYPNGITEGHIDAAQTILGALGLVLPSVIYIIKIPVNTVL